jgi:hypothetical protein
MRVRVNFKTSSRVFDSVISAKYSGGFLIIKIGIDSTTTRDVVISCSVIEDVITDWST